MTHTRDNTLDIMKFLLIGMMVWGHVGIQGSAFIHVFNMPVFFMISGIFFKECLSFSDLKTFTLKKIKGLYIPYILTNLGFLVFHNLFIKIGFYAHTPEILEFYPDLRLYDFYSAKDFFKRIILTLTFVGGTQFGGATWFLRALFFSSILFEIFDLIFTKIKISKKLLAHFAVGLVLLVLAVILNNFSLTVFDHDALMWLKQSTVPYLLFPMGKLFYSHRSVFSKNIVLILTFVISFVALLFLSRFEIHRISGGIIYKPVLFLLGSVLGFVFVFAISAVISKVKFGNVFAFCGKFTIYVLSLHLLFFKIVTFIFIQVKNLPSILLASYPTCYGLCEDCKTKIIVGGGYIFIGVFLPNAVGMVVRKIKDRSKNND